MIARIRELTLKQYDVMQKEVQVRLTADKGQVGDCYIAIQLPTSKDSLRELAELHGKRYRVTVEEID